MKITIDQSTKFEAKAETKDAEKHHMRRWILIYLEKQWRMWDKEKEEIS